MGTNYYLRKNICACCDRYDKLHIGKSSSGWSFSFRGYRKQYDDDDIEEIKSFSDWKEQFKVEGVKIFNEYGDEVTLQYLFELIESKRGGQNHTTYCKIHHPRHAEADCWLDDEGNSFDDQEFS